MKKTIQDERVLAQKRKISSDAFQLVWIALIISVLVQQYLFDAPFSQYCVEFICFFMASIYILVRNFNVGNDIYGDKNSSKKIILINSLVVGISVGITVTALNYAKYGHLNAENLSSFLVSGLITFIVATFVSYLIASFLNRANRKKQASIETKLDEDEKV